jgi:DNA-directed RNA polymerase sigma subunit (sigma70/sigma32)
MSINLSVKSIKVNKYQGDRAMQTIDINKDDLFSLIKKAVREVMQEEMSRKWLEGLPMVTDEEQEDIKRRYGKPDRTKNIESRETVDL